MNKAMPINADAKFFQDMVICRVLPVTEWMLISDSVSLLQVPLRVHVFQSVADRSPANGRGVGINSIPAAPNQEHNLSAIDATWRPWKRAWASSFSLGWREPSAPAMVAAPHGEPPLTSLMSAISGQEYGSPT